MGLFDELKLILKPSAVTPHQEDAAADPLDEFFAKAFSYVEKPSMIADLREKYDQLQRLAADKRAPESLPLYFALESFITTQTPPVVKQKLTKTELRAQLSKTAPIDKLHETMQLIFFPTRKMRLSLYAYSLRPLGSFISKHTSIPRLGSLVTQSVANTPLEAAIVGKDGIDFHIDALSEKDIPAGDITSAFHALFTVLYKEIRQSYSEKHALEIVSDVYNFITTHYDREMVMIFLDVLPAGVFEREKNAFLSREELEKKAAEVTLEKEQKEAAEKNARELAEKLEELNATKAATLNLLQDSLVLEEELKAERDRAKTIIASMGDGMVVIDKNFKISLMNPVAEMILETTFLEAKGAGWNELVSIYKGERELTGGDSPLGVSMTTGEKVAVTLEDDLHFRTRSGRMFPVAVAISPLSGRGITGAVIVFRDITAEKEAKRIIEDTVKDRTRQLREEQARLEASINSINVGFIMVDTNFSIVTINSAAKRIFYTPNEQDLRRKTAAWVQFDFTMEYLHEQLKKNFDLLGQIKTQCLAEKKTIEFKEIAYKNLFLRIFIAPIIVLKEQLDVIGAVLIIEDITEAKVMERSKDEFFSIASHELRTPLTAIRGNTSLIREYYQKQLKDPDLVEMINDIHESAIRLIEIVNDFLDLSRLEQKRIEFKIENFAIEDIIEDILKEYQTTISEKDVKLVFNHERPLPHISGDKNRIKQVLINLVGNSLKFTAKGSVTVEGKTENEHVKIYVKDTGRGIPDKNKSLLFRKFQQAGNSIFTRDTTKGTGLGLYISKLLMEGMDGDIALESSEEGKGTTFSISVPLADQKKEQQPHVIPMRATA